MHCVPCELPRGVLEQEQASLKKDVEKLYDLYFGDHVTKEGFTVKYTPLSERMKQLDDQIPTLQGELDFLKIQHLSQEEVISEATDLYTRWPALEHEEKRRIVENITQRITIGDAEVEIDLCYLPNSAELMAGKQRDFNHVFAIRALRLTLSGLPNVSAIFCPCSSQNRRIFSLFSVFGAIMPHFIPRRATR